MKKWMLVACVALLGLAQASDRIVDGDQDQEVGRVTPPTTSTTPMVGLADTTEKEEWPPLDVRYLEPVGFHWPDNPEEGKAIRFLALAGLLAKGNSPKDAVDIYYNSPPAERKNLGFDFAVGVDFFDPEMMYILCEAKDPEELKLFLRDLYTNASNCY